MESFHSLDFDWEGKVEPSSPSSQDSVFAEEIIFDAYNFCNEDLFNNALFDIVIEDKPIIKSELMQDSPMIIKLPAEEKVAKDQWLGQKLKMPQLVGSYVQSNSIVPVLVAPEIGPFQPQPVQKVQNTEELLMEFDCVYENVELTHLTPPQTPPQEVSFVGGQVEQQPTQSSLFLAVQPDEQQQQQQVPTVIDEYYGFGAPMNGLLVNSIQTIVQQQAPAQEVPGEYQLTGSFGFQPVDDENIARNLELVEEIVRSRSKDLPDCNEDDDSCSFSEAGSSSPLSDSSSSSYCGSAYSRDQDDEWSPTSSSSSSNRRTNKTSGGGVTKKRTRPYGRGIEDKKSRKKEQNKNAATRYRQKKKAEIEEILIEENQLRERNEELKSKSADIGREIRYLKSLMREVYKAKGLI